MNMGSRKLEAARQAPRATAVIKPKRRINQAFALAAFNDPVPAHDLLPPPPPVPNR